MNLLLLCTVGPYLTLLLLVLCASEVACIIKELHMATAPGWVLLMLDRLQSAHNQMDTSSHYFVRLLRQGDAGGAEVGATPINGVICPRLAPDNQQQIGLKPLHCAGAHGLSLRSICFGNGQSHCDWINTARWLRTRLGARPPSSAASGVSCDRRQSGQLRAACGTRL